MNISGADLVHAASAIGAGLAVIAGIGPGVGQRIMAAAINAPVSLMETAGEGGAWGIALLASYMLNKKENQPLDAFLSEEVFHGETGVRMEPNAEDVAGFDAFIQRYKECLPVERAAVESLPL